MMNNKSYDILKWVALVVLPAMAALYTSLAPVWGLPFENEIPLTLNAINTFLGALIGVSSIQYAKKGD